MRTIVIVPAKAQSERLPGKNTLRVGSHTLVEHAIAAAKGVGLVVVASDSEAILRRACDFAQLANIEAVPHVLSAELVGKRVPMEDVIEDVIRLRPADRYVLLQPTSPLRRRRHVASALAILERTGCDSVLSVHEVTKEVYFSGTLDRDGRFTSGRPPNVRMFTNDLPKLVTENGAIYAWTHDHWRKTHSRMGGDCRAMEMLPEDAIDIDTPAELERAQRWFGGEVT